MDYLQIYLTLLRLLSRGDIVAIKNYSIKFVTKLKRIFINSPKKITPKRKLKSKEKFFKILIKLKLNVLLKDICDRFEISPTHCGPSCKCCLRESTKLLH